MKPRMYAFLLLVVGCDPTDPFISFRSSPSDDAAKPLDAGGADTSFGGNSGAVDAGETPDAGEPSRMDGCVDCAPKGSGGAGGASTGGSLSTGGASTGGAAAGGAHASGGVGAVDACVLVTHINGFNATWQDCVPLATYNKEQATKACKASGAPECRSTSCGAGSLVVCGYNEANGYVYGCWGYAGALAGRAEERSDSCSGFNLWTWG